MRKLVPFLVVTWLLIGALSFFVWWKLTRNLTPETMTSYANRIAQELEIPWELRFGSIHAGYGADFRVIVENLVAVAKDKGEVLRAKRVEVRLPWTILLSRNPVRINVTLSEVNVGAWTRILAEAEHYLEQRRIDATQEVSVPSHIAASVFNLRFNNVVGTSEGKERRLSKLYLLNVDPKKPTAFEVAFPWDYEWKGAQLSGETKILGEYRFASQKVDLHYYVKSRLQSRRGQRVRTGDVSLEGKGFYHPRMGLFTTVSAKEDWLAMVGDVEWSKQALRINVPKLALSKDLVLDLLPFTGLQGATTPYQNSSFVTELRFESTPEKKDFKFKGHTKSSAKLVRPGKPDQPFKLEVDFGGPASTLVRLDVGGEKLIDLVVGRKEARVSWSEELFLQDPQTPWHYPHSVVWDLLDYLPWEKLDVTPGSSPAYQLERRKDAVLVQGLRLDELEPALNLSYVPQVQQVGEWMTKLEDQSLDDLFTRFEAENPFTPAHKFSGAVHRSGDEFKFKLAWRGSALAVLARSSCRSLIAERPEIAGLLREGSAHQLELTAQQSVHTVRTWKIVTGGDTWNLSGGWSNSPVRCNLKLVRSVAGKKPLSYLVELN